MKEKYLPQWYLNNQLAEYKKYIKNIVILFMLFSLMIFINIYWDFKELVRYNNKIDTFMISKDNTEVRDFHIYQSFNYMYDILGSNKIDVRKFDIDYEDIYIEIYAEDMMEYKEKLGVLEKSFSISEISPLNSEDDKKYFGVRMKIYEN